MATFTETWDATYETLPPDTGEAASQGASRIRLFKTAVQERFAIDHSHAGDAHDGKHLAITMKIVASDPTLDAADGGLYAKTIATRAELFYKDSDANVKQLTSNGDFNGLVIGTNIQAWDANLDQIAALAVTDSNFMVGNGSAWVAESGATVRASLGLTDAGILAAVKNVDGPGSGLDADLLDGVDSLNFCRSDISDTVQELTFSASVGSEGGQFVLEKPATGSTLSGNLIVDLNADRFRIFETSGTNRGAFLDLSVTAGAVATELWHSDNDGPGSGLDADLLDGIQASGFHQTGGTDVPIADGGTGSSTAAGARTNLGVLLATDFTSADQTITTAGLLTLAHSLGAEPSLVQVRLKCTTAELNYSIGDELISDISTQESVSVSKGLSVVVDSTNVKVRYGSSNPVFSVLNKDTGVVSATTNGNWKLIVKAWV